MRLKPLKEQVIVITGASSGIGLATARESASRGAKLVLVARSEPRLRKLAEELRTRGGQVVPFVADVGDPDALERAADEAIRTFGRIDTWINNAGVGLYGKLTETHLNDKRRVVETNFWGVVHGSRSAARRMRVSGGAIINIGSALSYGSLPLQGVYSASKSAVKSYTDALRMEFRKEKVPISVTLIKPSSTDTPYFKNAALRLNQSPKPVPPVYSPETVARAILVAAERPTRELAIGGQGRLVSLLSTISPMVAELFARSFLYGTQLSHCAAPENHRDNLHAPVPGDELRSSGGYTGVVLRHSRHTAYWRHPFLTFIGLAALGALTRGVVRGLARRRPRQYSTEGTPTQIGIFTTWEMDTEMVG